MASSEGEEREIDVGKNKPMCVWLCFVFGSTGIYRGRVKGVGVFRGLMKDWFCFIYLGGWFDFDLRSRESSVVECVI